MNWKMLNRGIGFRRSSNSHWQKIGRQFFSFGH